MASSEYNILQLCSIININTILLQSSFNLCMDLSVPPVQINSYEGEFFDSYLCQTSQFESKIIPGPTLLRLHTNASLIMVGHHRSAKQCTYQTSSWYSHTPCHSFLFHSDKILFSSQIWCYAHCHISIGLTLYNSPFNAKILFHNCPVKFGTHNPGYWLNTLLPVSSIFNTSNIRSNTRHKSPHNA